MRLFSVSVVALDVSPWIRSGFLVRDDRTIHLTNFIIRLLPSHPFQPSLSREQLGENGMVGWEWSSEEPTETLPSLPGIETAPWNDRDERVVSDPHPNKMYGIDHVVLQTTHLSSVLRNFGDPRRKFDAGEKSFLFYRSSKGGPILEVIAPSTLHTATTTPESNILWGMTFISSDIHDTVASLREKGEFCSEVRKAKQKDRLIATVRSTALGIHTKIAVMSPHLKKPTKL